MEGRGDSSLVGRRVSVDEKRATVLFEGKVGSTKGAWLGVEWDDASRGKHDGTHEGIRYFSPQSTSPTSCSFLRHNKVNFGVDLFKGVNLRYGKVEGETAGVGQDYIDDLQKEIGARFVQVTCQHIILHTYYVRLHYRNIKVNRKFEKYKC